MEPQIIDQVKLAGSVAAHDLSAWGLFLQADWLVKMVLLALALASVWVWAIIFEKLFRLRHLDARALSFEERFWSGGSLDTLYDRIGKQSSDPMTAIFIAGMREWRSAADKGLLATAGMRASLQQRVDRVMQVTIGREMASVESGMTLLASVGSAAPFVGLFGTVWGIIKSFTAIAAMQNTSLAVVAPGIAEALFATAIGLVAAIPAVLAYNKFSNDLARYTDRLENFSVDFSTMLSRHLEEQRI